MNTKYIEIENFIKNNLNTEFNDSEATSCAVFEVNKFPKVIDAIKLNFHLVILCIEGSCNVSVAHHNFLINKSSISIIPPHTIFSIRDFTENFNAYYLLFQDDFIKKGFVKSEIMNDLLFINPDYPPTFELDSKNFTDSLYKFLKIKDETESQSPFCLEISRLYILQVLYDYNRTCEICLLNSDKLINRQFQVMYAFKKLVELHFHNLKTVKEYANLMFLSSKYVSECVKNQTGISAMAVIQNRIMLEAELLLKYSQLPIKSISDSLGFNSTSSFSRFFKGLKGVSPINYQQEQEN